jgi:hypothetical protein
MAVLRDMVRSRETPIWLPWLLIATVLLYFVGYVDGSVHGAVLGDAGLKLNYVHEFFHHARHVAMMCH